MYYLIQENVFRDPRYNAIFSAVEAMGLPYEVISFAPGSNNFSFETQRKDVFVYGSVKLAKLAATYEWSPGSFYGGNHEFERYAAGYGKHVINHGSYLGHFTDRLDWAANPQLFIKPQKEAKVFTGKVFNEPEWQDFVYESLQDTSKGRLSEKTAIMASAPYSMIKEARVWIIGDRVVTSSYYKFHGDQPFEVSVSEEGLAFAHAMAQHYRVASAYVMDIALTLDGWKIVEVNCINSAGFYGGNVDAIVAGLEAYF